VGQHSSGQAGRRPRRWAVGALGAVLTVGAVAGGAGLTSSLTGLRSASYTNPTPPSNVVVVPADRALQVSWTASTEPGVVGYRVWVDGVPGQTSTTTSATVTGLVNGHSYVITVRAGTLVAGTATEGTTASAPATGVPADQVAPGRPVPPTPLRGDGRVSLSWTAATEYDVDGYRVLRDGTPVSGLVAGRGTTTWVDTDVVNDHTYGYALQVHDTSGNWSPASTPLQQATPTDLTAPATPTGLSVAAADRRAELSWAPAPEPDVVAHRVYRDGTEVAVVRGATSWADTGLVDGHTYSWTLVAEDGHGNRSLPTAPVTATPRDTLPPAVPAAPTATPRDGAVELSWPGDPDAASWRVRRDGAVVATVTTPAYRDEGLTNGTAYRYTLVAVDAAGNPSAPSTPEVVASPEDQTPPAAPTGLSAVPGDHRVELSWAPNAEPDVAAYRLYRDGTEVAVVRGATSWVDPGLADGRSYTYTLVAEDGHANRSLPSAPVPVTLPDATAPAVPAAPTVTPQDGAVELSWPADPDVASWRVLRDGQVVATVTGTSHRDEGLTNGTPYRYTLVAVDAAGNASAASAQEAVATPADRTAPGAPTAVTATPGDGQVTVSWTAGSEPDLAAHRVLAADGTVVATVPVPATQAVVRGLANGAAASFTVVAVDSSGNPSPASAAVAATPVARPVPVQGAGETGGLAVSGDGRFVVVGTRAPLEAGDTNTAYELYLQDRTAGTARRIAPLPATATGATDPTNTAAPAVSDDGRYVALATTAALVPEDTNRLADVYRLDTTTGRWTPVRVRAGGRVSAVAGTVLQSGPSVYATSPSVAMSASGDLVLFYSARTDLVARDTNGVVDVFAKSMTTGVVTRVSSTATGTDLPRTALGPALALTPDGRFALFPALSSSGPVVLYRKTLSGAGAGAVVVVSSVVSGGRTTEFPVHRDAGDVDLSDDGRYVALVTTAKLGTATPTAGWSTGLAHRVDTATGTSVAMGDGQTTAWEHQVALDPTGRYGFFATAAAMVPGDGNGHTDHLRRDLDGGVPGPLALVTADSTGRAGAGPVGSITPAEYGRAFPVTGDRVYVTTTNALQSADTNGVRDLYLADLAGGTVRAAVG
jgi:fibronectin type 3 domain-containing protein